MIFQCFGFEISLNNCMLFVRRFVVVIIAADVADVVMIFVPLLPFVCAILELMIF